MLKLFAVTFEYQTSISSTESEVVGKYIVDFRITSLIRYVIEITIRVRKFVVDRGRQLVFHQSFDRENSLKSAGGSESVAGHRFGRADWDIVGVLAKHLLYREGLKFIVVWS